MLVDVFISYTRADMPIAQALAETLGAEGFEVWWDSEIYAGAAWESLLLDVLAKAKAVVVLWSPRSVGRPWVLKEADVALESNRFVPVMIEACDVPARFMVHQSALMPGWNGRDAHAELERLLAGIAALAPPSRIETVRPGYDSEFLGTPIELPVLNGVADEFRYLHFSVVMNPARRLAWLVAYNAGAMNAAVQRGDAFQADPALPRAFQPQNEHFRGTGFDRGHLVAPSLVSWGADRQAQLANHQAFFFTNTAPQAPDMNRRWWQVVEAWERDLAIERERLVGFAGAVLGEDDPAHGAVEQTIGRLRVRQNFRLPRAFWKIVVARSAAGQLEVASFYWDQAALLAKPPAGHVEPRMFASTIAHIEQATGLDFGPVLREAQALLLPPPAEAGG